MSLLVPLADPALPRLLTRAVIGAGGVTAIAVPLGLCGALLFSRAAPAWRTAAAVLAVLVLLLPAPPYAQVDFARMPSNPEFWPLACAIARGAAAAGLILAAGLRRVPPGLRQAALLAGARPVQAWRHAILAPLFPYFACAIAAVLAVALAQGPAASLLPAQLDTARAWAAPAALLLAVAALAAMLALGRRPSPGV